MVVDRAPEPDSHVLRRVFKAFEYPNFRLLWFGACLSSIGTWMQSVAQNWLVLELSNRPFLLGLDAFLGQIPIFLFSLVGGVIADRVDRRKLLVGSQLIQLACAFLLAAMFAFSTVQVWQILCLSFVVGVAQAFGGPAYQALIPTLVAPKDLPNAIALNSIQFNLARVIGPLIGGVFLTKLGPAWCFTANGISYIFVIVALVSLPLRPIVKQTGSLLSSMKEGLVFIRDQESMSPLILIAFCMTALGIPLLVFLPVVAKDVFRGGPELFTLLLCISAAGSVVGALLVAGLGNLKRKGQFALWSLIGLGILMIGFGLSRSLQLSCLFLFLAGAALMAVFAMISSLVQLVAPDEMRGRVMSVYNVAFRGGMPFGSLVAGALIPYMGVSGVMAADGILLAFLGAWFLLVQRRVSRL